METHDILILKCNFFVIYVTVLCEPRCDPNEPKSMMHI